MSSDASAALRASSNSPGGRGRARWPAPPRRSDRARARRPIRARARLRAGPAPRPRPSSRGRSAPGRRTRGACAAHRSREGSSPLRVRTARCDGRRSARSRSRPAVRSSAGSTRGRSRKGTPRPPLGRRRGRSASEPASIVRVTEGPAAQRPRPRKGEEVEVTIDSLAHGGAGVGRADGFVVFVRGAVPGDRVRARVEKAKRSFAEARASEIWSRARTASSRVCATPRRALAGAAVRAPAGGEGAAGARRARPAGRLRGPARGADRAGGRAAAATATRSSTHSVRTDPGELTLGFHRPGRWDLIDDRRADVLASERVDEVREAVRAWCAEEGLSPLDRSDHSGFLRNLVVREGRRTGQIQARLVTSQGAFRGRGSGRCAPGRERAVDPDRGRGGDDPRGQDQDAQGAEAIEEELEIGGTGWPSRSRPRPSSRPTRRWPSGSTRMRSSWPA